MDKSGGGEMLAFLCLSVLALAAASSIGLSGHDPDCPLWTVPLNGTCRCADDLKGTVHCEDGRGALQMKKCFCMTSQASENTPIVGTCLYKCDLVDPTIYNITTNSTVNLTNTTCGGFGRTGVMCSECLPDHGLPVYSYSLSCVHCSDYRFNWLKYVAVAYIPLTIFYILVILLRVSATSGYLLGYVTICQMITLKALGTLIFNATRNGKHVLVSLISILLSVWNLDFFRSLYRPFCLSPHLTILHLQLLDYLTAVYPLILVLVSYALVKLHDRFRLVVFMCRPFYKCLHVFRKEWDVKDSLIGSFATFYLLSYVEHLC